MTDSVLLPFNATPQELELEASTARISDIPVPIRDVYNPATCPLNLLPWLAWAFSVDAWSVDWTETQKRSVIQNALNVQKHKGTVSALDTSLSALGYDITMSEWFQLTPAGNPYTFGLDLDIQDQGIPTVGQLNSIVSVANGAKNVRSELSFINIESTRNAEYYYGGVSFSGNAVVIGALPVFLANGAATANGAYHANGLLI